MIWYAWVLVAFFCLGIWGAWINVEKPRQPTTVEFAMLQTLVSILTIWAIVELATS